MSGPSRLDVTLPAGSVARVRACRRARGQLRVLRRLVVIVVGPGDDFALGPYLQDVTLRTSILIGSLTINRET